MRREKNWVRQFDIDDPQLPPAIKEGAFTSGGYPYEKDSTARHTSKS